MTETTDLNLRGIADEGYEVDGAIFIINVSTGMIKTACLQWGSSQNLPLQITTTRRKKSQVKRQLFDWWNKSASSS